MLIVVTAVVTGCIKARDTANPVLQPQGSFTGDFYRIHTNFQSKVKDTIKLTLGLELVNNTYKITGDTSKHAGSKGTFNYNQSYIEWTDGTLPIGANGLKMPKYHLYGPYLYFYDGTKLEFRATTYPIDTLTYIYKLKKITN